MRWGQFCQRCPLVGLYTNRLRETILTLDPSLDTTALISLRKTNKANPVYDCRPRSGIKLGDKTGEGEVFLWSNHRTRNRPKNNHPRKRNTRHPDWCATAPSLR